MAYTKCFGSWAKKKPSGGPEQYLTHEEKVRIFKAVTKNFIDLSDEQIQQLVL